MNDLCHRVEGEVVNSRYLAGEVAGGRVEAPRFVHHSLLVGDDLKDT